MAFGVVGHFWANWHAKDVLLVWYVNQMELLYFFFKRHSRELLLRTASLDNALKPVGKLQAHLVGLKRWWCHLTEEGNSASGFGTLVTLETLLLFQIEWHFATNTTNRTLEGVVVIFFLTGPEDIRFAVVLIISEKAANRPQILPLASFLRRLGLTLIWVNFIFRPVKMLNNGPQLI